MASTGTSLAYRLVIEGLGIEFCTDAAMEDGSGSDGRTRVNGLKIMSTGATIGENVDPARAELEGEGVTFQIVDRQLDDIITAHLAQQPSVVTYMTADLTSSGTALTVESSTGFTTNDVIHVGTETMQVSTVSAGPPAVINVVGGRAYRNTVAMAHYAADGEELRNPAVSLTYPTTLEGRRAFLYEYQDGASLTGNGTLIWRGVCTTDAALADDGSTWSIKVDHITSIFKQDLGGDLEREFRPRGIYFPASLDLRWVAEQVDEPTATGGTISKRKTVHAQDLSAFFFETQAEFCEALTSAFNTATSTWSSWQVDSTRTPTFVADGEDDYHLEYTLHGTNKRFIRINALGPGRFLEGGLGLFKTASGSVVIDEAADVATGTPITVTGGGANDRGDDPRTVPRGAFGIQRRRDLVGRTSTGNPWRIYLDGGESISGSRVSAVSISWPDGFEEVADAVDAVVATRYVDLGGAIALMPMRLFTRDSLPVIKFMRGYASAGSVADFLTALTSNSVTLANSGGAPFCTAGSGSSDPTGDVVLADWTSVIGEAGRGRDVVTSRQYAFSGGVDFGDTLMHECRIAGIFPRVDSNGRISAARLFMPTDTDAADFTLDTSNIIVSGGFPQWERNGLGSINVVEFATGYDYGEDKHTGTPITVRDVAAISERKQSKALKVEPKSLEVGSVSYTDYVEVAQTVTGIFGRPYSVIELDVPYTLWSTALLGTVASVTCPWVPSTVDGTRGITARRALVIGRQRDLSTPVMRLTLLMVDRPIVGYTPTVFFTQSGAFSGTDLTGKVVSFNDPVTSTTTKQTSHALSDLFPNGSIVDVMEWDNVSPTIRRGTTSAVDDGASSFTITFGSSATLTDTVVYMVRYSGGTDGVTAAQQTYAYLAGDDARIGFPTEAPAKRYGI